MVQEKKNMLRVWNAVLVSLAFCLSLFGTFLTRSGVISSIHSFTQSSIGPWLLGFIAVVAAVLDGADLLAAAAAADEDAAGSRWPRARRRSSTTTCCSLR
jgi:cytochrome c biogenesis factor